MALTGETIRKLGLLKLPELPGARIHHRRAGFDCGDDGDDIR